MKTALHVYFAEKTLYISLFDKVYSFTTLCGGDNPILHSDRLWEEKKRFLDADKARQFVKCDFFSNNKLHTYFNKHLIKQKCIVMKGFRSLGFRTELESLFNIYNFIQLGKIM